MPKRRHFPLSNARSCSQTVYIPWCIHPSGDTRLGIVGAYQTRWSMSQTCTRCSLRHLQIATGLKGSYLYTVEMSIFKNVHGLNTVIKVTRCLSFMRACLRLSLFACLPYPHTTCRLSDTCQRSCYQASPRHDGRGGEKGMGWHLQIYGVGKYWHDQPFVGRAGLINHAQAGSYIGVGSKYGLLP